MNDEEIDSRVKNLLAQPEGYLDDEGLHRAVMDRLPPQRQHVLHTLRRRARAARSDGHRPRRP
jgi:hypothetical protein